MYRMSDTQQQSNSQIDECRLVAIKAHAGQYRRDGTTAYIYHCYEVGKRVNHLGDKYVCVALLHDVLEDTKVTAHDLLEAGIDEDIVTAVQILTKHPSRSYDEYLKIVKMNNLARNVKIADMLSNLADSPTIKQIRKYSQGLLFLTK
jgi:(p)ppGpp synthase/HD superfamily hydrolase